LRGRWGRVTFQSGPEGTLTVGDNVEINYGTLLSAEAKVVIGNRVMIGNCCIVADSEVPRTDGDTSRHRPLPIEIGDDAWLAVRVTVLPGSKIGAGSVITAGSVVSGEIPPGVVAGGIPARVIRSLSTNAEPAVVLAPAPSPQIEMRGYLISDFTIDVLAQRIRALENSPALEAELAPFGQVVPTLMAQPPSDAKDFAVVWTEPGSTIHSFGRLLAGDNVDETDILAEVDSYCETIARAAPGYRFVFVPVWTRPSHDRGLGLLDLTEGGAGRALMAMNLRLTRGLAKTPNVHLLNAARWVGRVGKNAMPPKGWYLGKVPFHTDVFSEAASDIQSAIRSLTGQSRKLLILDLDDTVWGGIVGDVGWENLQLGGHDGEGEAFVDFQRAVKALTRRGVVLGIVSKNEEATALEAIRMHPEMILREGDFVGHRINWQDKAANVQELTAALNLGLQSVVFIDDNPVERARVREALPEVFVPEWPEDKLLYRSALEALRCFDIVSISKEDTERSGLYAVDKQRKAMQHQLGSIDEWQKSLGSHLRVEPLAEHNRQRTTQLLNKTNQLNLTTRRVTEAELVDWSRGSNRAVWAITVADKFGDAGLTGVLSVERASSTVKIVDFVLSCRVMGRKVENALAHIAVEYARSTGAETVVADYLKTSKNKPCLDFWVGSGFKSEDLQTFSWSAKETYPLPEALQLEWNDGRH